MHDIMTVCCSPKVWWKIWLSVLAELLPGSSAGTCCMAQLSTVSTGKTGAASLSLQPEETAFFHFDFFPSLLASLRKCLHVCLHFQLLGAILHFYYGHPLKAYSGSGAPAVRVHLFPSDAAFGGRFFSVGCTASLACIHCPALGSLARWSPVIL